MKVKSKVKAGSYYYYARRQFLNQPENEESVSSYTDGFIAVTIYNSRWNIQLFDHLVKRFDQNVGSSDYAYSAAEF